jgi:GNAT superfamily N-acetyltransferase
MKFKKVEPKEYDSELFELLYSNEDEFKPDFSEEEWGLEENQDLKNMDDREVVRKNFEAIFYKDDVETLVCIKNKEIIGFLTVHTDFKSEDLPEKMTPCAFVLLTLVDKEHRNKGIAKRLNKIMKESVDFNHKWIARRTQKPNKTSQEYIKSLGFNEITRTKEQGYEQIYYALEIEKFKNR